MQYRKERVRKIELAREEHLERLLKIYDHAKAFMVATGNPHQWSGSYPERELLLSDIAKGQLYAYYEGEELHGVFVYVQGEDPTYGYIEGDWLSEESYGTIHRIASDGKVHGMLEDCVAFCLSRCGNLRVDTHEDNHVMQHLLQKNGFRKCGIIYLQNGAPRIAYQYQENMV